MSGATIGGAVGYVVGSFFGPAGAQIGFMIGSAIGGYVDPTKVYGPRLSDLRGQTSSVGGAIPMAWGTAPVPGNIIWQQPGVTEHRHTDDGKGSGQEQITYTYTRSYAIMFHLGEIVGVLQIKRNGKVVLDIRDDATLRAEYEASGLSPTDAAARITAQRAENTKWLSKCVIYTGTQTQDPDPTIESYNGVGNAPSYRGRAYFVVTDDETQAGEIAQFEIVVASCGTANNFPGGVGASWVIGIDGVPSVEFSPDGLDWSSSGIVPSPAWHPNDVAYSATNGNGILLITPVAEMGTEAFIFSSNHGATWSVCEGLAIDSTGGDCLNSGGYWHVADGFHKAQRSANGTDYSVVATAPEVLSLAVFNGSLYGLGFPNRSIHKADISGSVWAADSPTGFSSAASANSFLMDASAAELGAVGVEYANFGGGGANDSRCHIHSKSASTGLWTEHTNPFPDVLDTSVKRPGVHHSTALGIWVISFHNRVAYGPSLSSLTLSSRIFPQPINDIDSDNNKVVVCGDGGLLEWSVDGSNWTELAQGTTKQILTISSFYGADTPVPDAPGWYVTQDGELYGPAYSTITPCSNTTVGEIVFDVCGLSGLTADEIDVSQLTDTLDGFVIARETDGASVIESLRPVGMFDPAEWDKKFRGIKRGGVSVGSINSDDLVERNGDAFERELVQQVELLRKVTVGYLDTQAGWSPNTQAWERRVGTINARGESVIEVSAVFGADQGASIAKRKGLVSWGEPEKQKLSLPYRLAKYTPTDVLNYTGDDAEVETIRLMQIDDDSGVRLIESATNCAEAYSATATGVAPSAPTITDESLRGPTYAVYMNLPSLRTQDNVPGVYIGACGLLAGWQGAAILLSSDGGVSYQQVTTFTQPSAMGRLTSGCTSSSEPISVFMNEGQLSSITAEQIIQRHNAFAITTDDVSELGQFQTATATATDTYDITDNVRGLLGTTATSHNADDPFVMASTAQFLPLDISWAGLTLYFKAVTFGTSPDAAEAVPFVFSPLFTSVVVEAYTDDAGNVYTDDADNIYYYEAFV